MCTYIQMHTAPVQFRTIVDVNFIGEILFLDTSPADLHMKF